MILRAVVALLIILVAAPTQAQQATPPFQKFLTDLWKDAEAQGITRATFDRAFLRRYARSARHRNDKAAARVQQAGRALRQSDRIAG
jgi:membrane-bound lytic murein transglycosylase B